MLMPWICAAQIIFQNTVCIQRKSVKSIDLFIIIIYIGVYKMSS